MELLTNAFNKIFGNTNSTYAEAVHCLARVENAIAKIHTSITNIDSNDFNIIKNKWVDLPSEISDGISVMGLHIDQHYTSLLGYYAKDATIKPHQHKYEWEIVKVLEGTAYDKTNDIVLKKGDVYIIPRNKIHGIVPLDGECYIYALFTSDKKYLKIPHTESEAAAKRYIHEVDDEELSKVNVLYIDDEIHNLESFKATYRREKFNSFFASNLNEAFEILKTTKIHVLFCDYMMPGTNGTEIIREIRSEYPGIVPVAVTAYFNEEIINELKTIAGVNNCISKPWKYEEIIESVKYSYNIHKSFGSK